MRKFELNIRANNKEWLYQQYIKNQRGLRDIAIECNTSEDSIRTRLKRFSIPIREHKDALKIRNRKYKTVLTKNQIKEANEKRRTGKHVKCKYCNDKFYVNKKSRKKYCSKECYWNYRRESPKRSQDWRDWPEYKLWRSLIYKRDSWKCVICSSKTKINAHHIYPGNDYPDKRFLLDNGIVLCEKHHIMLHKDIGSLIQECIKQIPNFGEHLEIDNPEASIRNYLISFIRSND